MLVMFIDYVALDILRITTFTLPLPRQYRGNSVIAFLHWPCLSEVHRLVQYSAALVMTISFVTIPRCTGEWRRQRKVSTNTYA